MGLDWSFSVSMLQSSEFTVKVYYDYDDSSWFEHMGNKTSHPELY